MEFLLECMAFEPCILPGYICKAVHILSSWLRKLLFKGCLVKNLVGQWTDFGIFKKDV